jgi:hypothetical protein
MFFSTTEHYKDDFVVPNKNDICFICLENENNYCNLIMLNHQQVYTCYCHCNGWIHHTCLNQWLNVNQTCPLCRRRMIKNNYFVQPPIDNNQIHPIFRMHIMQNTYFAQQFVKYLLTCGFYLFILMYYYFVGKTYVYIFDSILFMKLT